MEKASLGGKKCQLPAKDLHNARASKRLVALFLPLGAVEFLAVPLALTFRQ